MFSKRNKQIIKKMVKKRESLDTNEIRARDSFMLKDIYNSNGAELKTQ